MARLVLVEVAGRNQMLKYLRLCWLPLVRYYEGGKKHLGKN